MIGDDGPSVDAHVEVLFYGRVVITCDLPELHTPACFHAHIHAGAHVLLSPPVVDDEGSVPGIDEPGTDGGMIYSPAERLCSEVCPQFGPCDSYSLHTFVLCTI